MLPINLLLRTNIVICMIQLRHVIGRLQEQRTWKESCFPKIEVVKAAEEEKK